MILSKLAEILGFKTGDCQFNADRVLKKDTYSYEIENRKGVVEKGEIQAPSLKQAIRQLEKKSLSIISVRKAPPELPVYSRGIGYTDLMVFFRQLSIMWASGLSVQHSLHVLEQQSTNYQLKNLLISISTMLQQGESFTDALSHFPEIFSRFHIYMLKASEEGGFIDRSIDYLAEVMEKEEKLRRKVKAALTYPLAVFILGVTGCLAVFYWIYPFLRGLVDDLGIKLPFYARIMMSITDALRRYYIFIPFIILMVFVVSRISQFVRKNFYGKIWLERLLLRLPIIREIVKKAVITHMIIVLAYLARSGVPVVRALELTSEASDNLIIGCAFQEVSQRIKEGITLTESMSGITIFPKSLVAMISVGEETGELSEVLLRIASLYELELSTDLESFTKLIEPFAIALLGVIVGILLLSFFVPIYLTINAF